MEAIILVFTSLNKFLFCHLPFIQKELVPGLIIVSSLIGYFLARSNSLTLPGIWNLSLKIAAMIVRHSDGTRSGVSCCDASLMLLIFTCMVLSATMWTILWRRSR